MIDDVGPTFDESRAHRSVDEPHDAVMTKQQHSGEITDSRPRAFAMSADGEQQLVLGRRNPNRGGLLLTPPHETA